MTSEQHHLGTLNELLEFDAPLSGNRTVNHSVVTTQSHIHHARHCVGVLAILGACLGNYALLGSGNSQDAGLGRVNNSGEVAHAEHAEVRDGESATAQLVHSQFVLTSSASDVLHLLRDLFKSFQVDVSEDGSHQTVGGLHSEAHVDVGELTHEVVLPRGVSLGHLEGGHRGSLHHEVVNRDLGRRVGVETRSQGKKLVNVNGHGDVIVRDVLF